VYDYLIVGAGLSGITLAERLASIGKSVLLIDKRNHVGGNCYDYFDGPILVQKYGPHLFHTSSLEVFSYLSRFTGWNDYRHRVVAFYKGSYYPIPINRTTINAFFGVDLASENAVEEFLRDKRVSTPAVNNSRDVVISKYGVDLYDAFIKHYTKKQWDLFPEELDRSVLERLPIRYNDNPYYFADPYQGMPDKGFTAMFNKMLSNPNITFMANADYRSLNNAIPYRHLIYTGKIDEYYNYKYARLDYRCIAFVFDTYDEISHQPYPVVNFTEANPPYTRITEFKYFYNTIADNTICCTEYASWHGEPSYPVSNERNRTLLQEYLKDAARERSVSFVGRLGAYQYLNMDQAVAAALAMFKRMNC